MGRLTNWLAPVPSAKYSSNCLPVLGRGARIVSDLGQLRVRHQVPDPDQRADPQAQQRDGQREAQGQVGAQGGVQRVDPEADVGGDETAARDEREQETPRDDLLGVVGVGGEVRFGRQPLLGRLHLGAVAHDLAAVPGLVPGTEQRRIRRGSADHPVRALGNLRTPDLFHVAHQCSVPDVPDVPDVPELPGLCCATSHGSRRFAVSHIEISTRKPIPPRKTTRPSVTGPARPSDSPPGLGSVRVAG